MTRKRLGALLVGIIAIVVVAVIGLAVFPRSVDHTRPHGPQISANVPAAAWETLKKIDAGQWPEAAHARGTKGGERWRNAEHRLPGADSSGKPTTYQEWDVNPKRKGHSRDAQRIVTGSDGSAWYTGDHYNTFERMR